MLGSPLSAAVSQNVSRVFLSLGSNIDPEHWIPKAIEALRQRYGALDISPVYQTPAVGFDGDDFLNLAVALTTQSSLKEIKRELNAIEKSCARERGAQRFSARTMDIDILLFDDLVKHDEGYDIPRDEILEAAYVLKPLVDLEPELRHPETGHTFKDHWHTMAKDSPALVRVALLD